MQFHAVMIDETGCEFGHTFDAADRDAAWEYLDDRYPESRVDQLESSADTRERERRVYERLTRMMEDDTWDLY